MIGFCQAGAYSVRAIDAFQKARPELVEKYIRKLDDGNYLVIPEVRNRIKFHPHNLMKSLLLKEKFDLILIRNVLIYFSSVDQEKVISLIAPRMAEDGALIIGESESLNHITTQFKPIEPLIYRKNLELVEMKTL